MLALKVELFKKYFTDKIKPKNKQINKTGLWNHKGPASHPKAVLTSDELFNFL